MDCDKVKWAAVQLYESIKWVDVNQGGDKIKEGNM